MQWTLHGAHLFSGYNNARRQRLLLAHAILHNDHSLQGSLALGAGVDVQQRRAEEAKFVEGLAQGQQQSIGTETWQAVHKQLARIG